MTPMDKIAKLAAMDYPAGWHIGGGLTYADMRELVTEVGALQAQLDRHKQLQAIIDLDDAVGKLRSEIVEWRAKAITASKEATAFRQQGDAALITVAKLRAGTEKTRELLRTVAEALSCEFISDDRLDALRDEIRTLLLPKAEGS